MAYYSSLLHILSSFPGLGAVMTHKLADAFISQPQIFEKLKELTQLLNQHPLCPNCQLPHRRHRECQNCSRQSSNVLIFAKIIDSIVYDYIHPNSKVPVFGLKNLLDYKKNQGAEDIGLSSLRRFINKRQPEKIFFVANTSLEAQATAFYLEKTFSRQSFVVVPWPNKKIPTLAGLSQDEVQSLAMKIDSLIS